MWPGPRGRDPEEQRGPGGPGSMRGPGKDATLRLRPAVPACCISDPLWSPVRAPARSLRPHMVRVKSPQILHLCKDLMSR